MIAIEQPNEATASTGLSECKEREYKSIHKLKAQFNYYLDEKHLEIEERQEAERIYHGIQWTPEQVDQLSDRKQLPTVNNLTAKKINSIVGVINKLRLDPKAFPRNPKNQEGADLATAALRYVVDNNAFEYKEPIITTNLAVKGIAGVEWIVEPSKFGDGDIKFEAVNPNHFFYDPCSEEHDFGDASFMGVAKWVDVDTLESMFPDKRDQISSIMLNTGSEFDIDQERGYSRRMVNREKKQVVLVDHWYKHDGGWCYCIYAGNIKLDEGESYLDDVDGKPMCRYQMFRAFMDHEYDSYGMVRNLKWSQLKYNHRDSRALWLLNARRMRVEEGAFNNIDVARREAARPDGVVVYNRGFEVEFEDAKNLADMNAQIEFMKLAKMEIDELGPNPALIGEISNRSGRAIQLLQQAGISELGPLLLAYKAFKNALYRNAWALSCQYWQAERWIRITDNENVVQFIPINQKSVDEYGNPQTVNKIAEIDVDIIIDEGADTVNMMTDALETLQAAAAQGQNIPPQVMIELLSIPDTLKKKLLGMLEQATAPNPMAEKAAMLEMAQGEADIADKQAATRNKDANTAKTLIDAQLAPMNMMAKNAQKVQPSVF